MEESRENIVAILNHAIEKSRITQRKICEEAGLSIKLPAFNKRLRSRHGQEFNAEEVRLLWIYAHEFLCEHIDWLKSNPITARPSQSYPQRIKALADFHHQLTRFYATHAEQVEKYKVLGIQAYYHSYKYSYRWHKRILRSAAVIVEVKLNNAPGLVFIERQISPDQEQEEDTLGLAFSKTNTLWIEARETAMEQPRKFVLPLREIGMRGKPNIINAICGFSIETYAKYPNQHQGRHGGFASPVALQRIPDGKLPRNPPIPGDPFKTEHIDSILSTLTAGCGYLTRTDFARDASISAFVKTHMKRYAWSDSYPGRSV